MQYIIHCYCGTDIKGTDRDEVVSNGIEHAREGHALTITRDQMVQHVEVATE